MTFIPNAHFLDELKAQPENKEALMEAAENVAEAAEEIAEPAIMPRPGEKHFEATEWEGDVQAVNTDHAAHWREWGTAYTPVEGALRRATRAAGYRLEEGGPTE